MTLFICCLWPWSCPLGQSWCLCGVRAHVAVLPITLWPIKVAMSLEAFFPLRLEYSWEHRLVTLLEALV